MEIFVHVLIVIILIFVLCVAFFYIRKKALDNERTTIRKRQLNARQFPNEVYIPLVCEYVNTTKPVRLTLKGISMRPFLESDRDIGELFKHEGVKIGDVVLAEIEKGHFVLHRIDNIVVNQKKVSGKCNEPEAVITLRGDGNPRGTETCRLKDIRAICLRVIRNGKLYDLRTSKIWKFYSWWWTNTLFIRRYQLLAYRIIWRHELPARWKKKS